MFDDTEIPYITVGAACLMTGLSERQLRRCHAQGWLTPAGVDPRTGHRHYSRADVEDLRLFAALVATGMPASEAGKILVQRDGGTVLDHLEALQQHGATLRRLAPPPRGGRVRRLRMPAERVLDLELSGSAGVDDALGAWMARAAAHRGTGTLQLPRAARPEGLPAGPAACIPRPEALEPDSTVRLQLPWDDQPPFAGLEPTTWYGGEALMCDLTEEIDVPAASQALDNAAERLRLIDMGRRLLYTPGRERAALTTLVTT